MKTVHANKASDFLRKTAEARGCCRCGAGFDPEKDNWCSIAQVTNSLSLVGGGLCQACHASFGAWMREGEEGAADPC